MKRITVIPVDSSGKQVRLARLTDAELNRVCARARLLAMRAGQLLVESNIPHTEDD